MIEQEVQHKVDQWLNSNIDEESKHPIIEELQKNNRFRKELHLKRDVRASSRRTKRRDSRDKEKVELWVLAPKVLIKSAKK